MCLIARLFGGVRSNQPTVLLKLSMCLIVVDCYLAKEE